MKQNQNSPFPLLKVAEILQCLKDLGINISVQQLKNPTPELVHQLHSFFLRLLMGVSNSDTSVPNFEASKELSYLQTYDEAIPTLSFNRKVRQMLEGCEVTKCNSTLQIMNPSAKELLFQLSGILHFIKFREDRLYFFNQLTTQTSQLIESKDQLEKANQIAIETLESVREEKKNQAPKLQELDNDSQKLMFQLKQLDREQQELLEENKVLKQQITDYGVEEEKRDNEITCLREEVSHMEKKVIHNPEQWKQKIVDLHDCVTTTRGQIVDLESNLFELEQKNKNVEKYKKKLIKCLQIMAECDEERNKFRHMKKSLKSTELDIQEYKDEMSDLKMKEDYAKRQIHNLSQKLERLQQEHMEKSNDAKQVLDEAVKQRQVLQQRQNNVMKQLQQNYQFIRKLEGDIDKMSSDHTKYIQQCHSQFEEIQKLARNYHHSLQSLMI